MPIDKTQLVKMTVADHFSQKEKSFWEQTTFDYRLGVLEQMKREVMGSNYKPGVVRTFRKVSLKDKNK